jgi:hypothetical protein
MVAVESIEAVADFTLPVQMDQRPEQHLLHVLNSNLRLHARPHW